MTRTLRITLVVLGVLVAGSVVGYAGLFSLGVLPRLAFAPGWALVDQDGERLTSENLRGAVTLYTFTYTRNEDPRRATEAVMAAVQERLRDEDSGGIPIRLVTVSFDAEHDTPAVLRRQAAAVGADPDRWTFATADAASLRRTVQEGFGVWYEQQEDGAFAFDPVFIVVDGLGIVRARYRLGLPEAEWLVEDLRSVVREAQAADGTLGLAYEAAHLFSCYSVAS